MSDRPNVELIQDFAEYIRQCRQKKSLSRYELASITGISVPLIKSIESGKITPSDKDVHKIEKALKIILFENIEDEIELSNQDESTKYSTEDVKPTKAKDVIQFNIRTKDAAEGFMFLSKVFDEKSKDKNKKNK